MRMGLVWVNKMVHGWIIIYTQRFNHTGLQGHSFAVNAYS